MSCTYRCSLFGPAKIPRARANELVHHKSRARIPGANELEYESRARIPGANELESMSLEPVSAGLQEPRTELVISRSRRLECQLRSEAKDLGFLILRTSKYDSRLSTAHQRQVEVLNTKSNGHPTQPGPSAGLLGRVKQGLFLNGFGPSPAQARMGSGGPLDTLPICHP
ncbi:hypothetical protein PGTUg99_008048 [Puccinia graminis f. sp. tritici]|uniref:Uncharacterized protein n=1 Tax=Puccinia graminis f. sp. tritici TaxID=56615 RepID=A0A5B0R0U6_PUCGR|nr:hypothetical protein PGTUg99_008048 [Puccinia graminis f. sp. tritici]